MCSNRIVISPNKSSDFEEMMNRPHKEPYSA